jgi:glycosyltransferase involved in cell wall biosynthesis
VGIEEARGGRLRILLLSDEPRDTSMGGAKVALKLQAALRRQGHRCEALFRPDLGNWPRSQRLRLALGPWLARRAAAQDGRDFDVIDAASAEGWLLPRGRGAVVARSHGLEHHYYAELLEDARRGRLRKPWTHRVWYPATRLPQVAWALRRAARAIVPNRAAARTVAERGWQPAERIEVIPHGVDRAAWLGAPEAAERGRGLLYCGWWTPSKGVGYLAEAYARLIARGVRAPLTLLGVGYDDGTWERQQARVRAAFSAECQPLLRLLPRTRDEGEVLAAYRAHDALVCPSTSEGFGMVVMEALSQRLPVVCSRAAGAAEWLRDGCEALLVAPRDAVALAAAMERLWTSPELRRRMGEAGHATTAALSWDTIAERTAECYRRARIGDNTAWPAGV